MEQNITEALTKAGIELTSLAVKGTATMVNSKIQSVKEEKNADKLRNTYDEIINELLTERDQAVRIAQSYKEEFEKVTISDSDIEYLHNTLKQVITMLTAFSPTSAEQIKSMDVFIELLSKDTLKTMQLLGFNYREAIGEPLTEVCAELIHKKLGQRSNISSNNNNKNKKNK